MEGLDKKMEEAQERSRRYKQRMTEAYGRMIKERMFIERQLVLRTANHVRRGMAGPSKFSPKWEGPFVVREAHASGYYRLAQMEEKDLMDPINGKWLKYYYAKEILCNHSFSFLFSCFCFFPPSDLARDSVTRKHCSMFYL